MPDTEPSTRPALDAEWIDRLRRGEPSAYECVLDLFEAPIYRFFYYSHGDRELAMDQSADTFATLVTSVRNLKSGPEGFRGYLFGIARNVLRSGRRARGPRFENPEALETVAAPGPSQAELAAAREEFDRALGIIRGFPSPQRQVFLLRFVEGFSLEEVSEALGLPLNTVKSHIHRGRHQLRDVLRPKPGGESNAPKVVSQPAWSNKR